MIKMIWIFFIGVLMPMTARAEFMTGSQLYEQLAEEQRQNTYYFGGGYVIGVFDSLVGINVCQPGGLTVSQVSKIAFDYLQKHPELLNKSASTSVINAFTETWPCQK